MSEKNSKAIPVEEIIPEGDPLAKIRYVSSTATIISLIFGVVLCATLNWGFVISGLLIIALTILVKINVRDYPVLDIYDDHLIVYELDTAYARQIAIADIKEWTGKHGSAGADAVMLTLKDGEVIYKDTFMIAKAYRILNKIMPDKESQAIKDEENKKTKIKFDIPFLGKKDKK